MYRVYLIPFKEDHFSAKRSAYLTQIRHQTLLKFYFFLYCLPHCFYISRDYMALMSLAGDPSKFLDTFTEDPRLQFYKIYYISIDGELIIIRPKNDNTYNKLFHLTKTKAVEQLVVEQDQFHFPFEYIV